jgi:hypothetical protein
MSDRHLRETVIDLEHPIPDGVEAIAAVATNVALRDIADDRGHIASLTLVTFRDAKAKLCEIFGAPSAAVADDLIRALVRRESASAIAVVYAVPPPPETDADRAFNVAVECADGKFDSLVALRDVPTGVEFAIFETPHDDPDHQWFGVEPNGEFDITLIGEVGTVIRDGDA